MAPRHRPPVTADSAAVQMAVEALNNLRNYRDRRDPRTPRSEYVRRFAESAAKAFGFRTELASQFVALLGPENAMRLFQASEMPQRCVSIRTNTLKTTAATLKRELARRRMHVRDASLVPAQGGVLLVSTEGNYSRRDSKRQKASPGSTVEYLSGKYMLQTPSSVLPTIALDPRPGETVLDMCSAPGGKAAHIAALMNNSGVLLANDINSRRLPALSANLHRLGVANCILLNSDAVRFADSSSFPNFPRPDKILLDAPCTGTGIIQRDPSAKNRTMREVKRAAFLQKRLLRTALELVKPGGTVVYSTCSLTLEENEAVVNSVMQSAKKGDSDKDSLSAEVKVLPLNFKLGHPGITWGPSGALHPSLRNCRRVYPYDGYEEGLDGFFVAKLQRVPTRKELKRRKDKKSNSVGRIPAASTMRVPTDEEIEAIRQTLEDFIDSTKFLSERKEQLVIIDNRVYCSQDQVRIFAEGHVRKHVEAIGIKIGRFTSTTKPKAPRFSFEITALELFAKYARTRVYLDLPGSKSFLYGNNVNDEHRVLMVTRSENGSAYLLENCENASVIVYAVTHDSLRNNITIERFFERPEKYVPIGFGFLKTQTKSFEDKQPHKVTIDTKISLRNIGDLGQYLRA
eukprot:CAMPEP_0114490306 /NCGR_PEP_ID=MMETSP0109-20121206/2371_1 /TAXON_ID=29199 /ORGANISM="Chlorarachnion reptans, Strain CCCM449" /LENGTH=628 /DNA_ID=CAMNT_0001666913 /DNA_START=441 /DNA_END=2324 /DNA_ORIENTATION=+